MRSCDSNEAVISPNWWAILTFANKVMNPLRVHHVRDFNANESPGFCFTVLLTVNQPSLMGFQKHMKIEIPQNKHLSFKRQGTTPNPLKQTPPKSFFFPYNLLSIILFILHDFLFHSNLADIKFSFFKIWCVSLINIF